VIDPIIGFSFDANIDTSNSLPPALVSMLDGIESTINHLESQSTHAREKTSNQWDELSGDPALFKANIGDFRIRNKASRKKEVKPLLTTNWHQNSPYNTYTPILESKHAPVGCVATAMAQIMAYHQWPKKGIGTHTNSNNTSLTTNFNTTYNWINMSNHDLAKISYHAGIGADMKYTVDRSGTNLEKAGYALKKYFKYATSNVALRNYLLPDTVWHTKLQKNLNEGLPILYGGLTGNEFTELFMDDNTTGHAFVCDGYKIAIFRTYYHFNYGWEDSAANAYYNLSIIPFANSKEFDYYYTNHAIFNIKPNKEEELYVSSFKTILPTLMMMLLE